MRKHLKNLILITLMLVMILGLNAVTYANESLFQVTIDNEVVNFTEELGYPYLDESSSTMVPVRIISEHMGYKVEWENDTQKVLISNGDKKIELQIGKSTAIVNGETVPIGVQDGKPTDTKAVLVPTKDSSRTYVPLRFVSESMGAEVEYDRKDGVHHIQIHVEGNLEVHFIDVGQGDAILIKQGEHNMLIDAGDNKYEEFIVNYLKENEITKLDYVIGTHPHADHIGGLDAVIDAFDIGKIIMPKVTHTTKIFEDVLISIKNKGLKITNPNVGDNYELGDASFTIVASNSDEYTNLNNYSVVTRMEYGKTSFLFISDAEGVSENEMLDNDHNLEVDVLKVGHHGSDTSTTVKFLDAANSKYTVIQVDKNNKYGHPTADVMDRLEERNIKIYRNELDAYLDLGI